MNPSRGPKVPPTIGPAAYGAFARTPAASSTSTLTPRARWNAAAAVIAESRAGSPVRKR